MGQQRAESLRSEDPPRGESGIQIGYLQHRAAFILLRIMLHRVQARLVYRQQPHAVCPVELKDHVRSALVHPLEHSVDHDNVRVQHGGHLAAGVAYALPESDNDAALVDASPLQVPDDVRAAPDKCQADVFPEVQLSLEFACGRSRAENDDRHLEGQVLSPTQKDEGHHIVPIARKFQHQDKRGRRCPAPNAGGPILELPLQGVLGGLSGSRQRRGEEDVR
mmetsp:Transcript_67317/g.174412  ORF Transcript_67317/g.174412 Transcript_67317/m.174412 type:complete len:221 (-) Transcript_67317:164-826(-)